MLLADETLKHAHEERLGMHTVEALLEFVKNSGSAGEARESAEWTAELTESAPFLDDTLKNPAIWRKIEAAWPAEHSSSRTRCLAEALVRAGGLDLASRWLASEVTCQKHGADQWLGRNLHRWPEFEERIQQIVLREHCEDFLHAVLSVTVWKGLGDDLKNGLLTHVFVQYPGDAFDVIESYFDEVRRYVRFLHGDRFESRHPVVVPPCPPHLRYLTPPEIEKLRFVIEDAGDKKYRRRIQQMIAQRREAHHGLYVPPMDLAPRVAYSPNRHEAELIARLLNKALREGYWPAALPPVYVTSETPPLLAAYPELEQEDGDQDQDRRDWRNRDQMRIPRQREHRAPEEIGIEQLLGVYQPRQPQILIYSRGIAWCAERKHLDEDWLFAVVLVHEISHWLTHQLPRPGCPAWQTEMYVLGETDVHEGWAQLMTWWVADELGGPFKHTFEALNRHQSAPYRVFEQFKQEPVGKVMASLDRLRRLPWPARLQDWVSALA